MLEIGIDGSLVVSVHPQHQARKTLPTGARGQFVDQRAADALTLPVEVDVELVELTMDLR